MPLHYFVLETDPEMNVFEVDFRAKTWRLTKPAAEKGINEGELAEDGVAFLSPQYVELGIVKVSRKSVTYQQIVPTAH